MSVPDSSVTIIGASGALGFGLAVRLAAAGVAVTIGSRESERAGEAAERARAAVPDGHLNGMENAAAAAANELVVLSVPFRSHHETLTHIAASMRDGQLLIDATVPLAAAVGGKPTRMLGVWQGSAAQQAQELVPDGVGVVAALHTVSAAALLESIDGLRCVDAGRLEMARITESLTALLIAVNVRHKAHAGIRLTGLPDTLW